MIIGGTPLQKCLHDLEIEGADILVGTPGRTMDILSRCKNISLQKLEVINNTLINTIQHMQFPETSMIVDSIIRF